jgi:cardiolipin synthase
VAGVGRSIGAAVTGNRPLEEFELAPIVLIGGVFVLVALLGFLAPRLLAWPVAALAAWTAVTLFVEAWAMWRRRSRGR